MSAGLIPDLQQLVEVVPLDLLMQITTGLESAEHWDHVILKVLPLFRASIARELFVQIIRQAREQQRSVSELAFALQTACAITARHRAAPTLELVLSGPVFSPFDLRRTDEALLQLIQLASHKLTLISFALYRLDRLTSALIEAVQRHVGVRLLVDAKALKRTELESLYGQFLREHMEFFVWSGSNRDVGEGGVFHAKAAIADGYRLLVSSANLTEYAMTANVELGVLIEGGDLPLRTEAIFDDYLSRGFFARI